MNKTVTINLAGFSFTIEETAYDSLHTYLEAIKSFLADEEDMDEIIADIERRIAELLQERMQETREVVLQEDIDHVMEVLGDPKFFMSESMEEEEEPTRSEKRKQRRKSRKVYRNPDDQQIGGVCGGLGAYFSVDPLIFRLGFVISVIIAGIGIVPYLILWAVIPEAKTTAEKLEMEGEEVNVENIKKRFRKESENVKESFQKFKNGMKNGKNTSTEHVTSVVHEIATFIGTILRFVWNIFKRILGVVAIIFGTLLFLGCVFGISAFFFGLNRNIFGDLSHLGNSELIEIFFQSTSDFNFMLFMGSLFIITLIIGLILAGLSSFGVKMPNKTAVAITLPVVMFISIFAFVTLLVANIYNFDNDGKTSENHVLEAFQSDTLQIHANEDIYFSPDYTGHHNDNLKLLTLENDELISGRVMLDVEASSDTLWHVEINRYSNGNTAKEARQKASEIEYNFSQSASHLWFDPILKWNRHLKYRNQHVKITVFVPHGKYVYLADGCDRIIYDIDNVQNMYDGSMIRKYWLMSDEGLTLAE